MEWKMYLCARSCRRSLQADFCIIVRPFFFFFLNVLTFLEALTTVSVTFLKPGFLVTVAKLYLEKVCVTDVSDYYWNPTHYLQICVDNSCPWTQITISDSAWTAGCFIISHNCSVITFPALTCSLGLVISPCFSFQLRLLTLQLQLTAAPPDSARGLFLFWANISTLNNHQLFSKFILVDLQFKIKVELMSDMWPYSWLSVI